MIINKEYLFLAILQLIGIITLFCDFVIFNIDIGALILGYVLGKLIFSVFKEDEVLKNGNRN